MSEIELKIDSSGKGAFVIENEGDRQAEMVVGIDDKNITVFHTEVQPVLKGQNAGSQLLDKMVGYAREHNLKVIALCPFVSAQFKRHPEKFGDVWNQHWH
jgi:uncharacterized protein